MSVRQLWALGRALNLCLLNPMTSSKGMSAEISEVMVDMDITMLPGTQITTDPATDLPSTHPSWRLSNHVLCFRRRPRGNPSLGHSMLFDNNILDCCEVVEAACRQNGAAGRGAMLLIAGGLLDYTICVAFFPPRSSMPTKRYQKVCSSIANFVRRQLSNCPTHSTPIVAIDNSSDYCRT